MGITPIASWRWRCAWWPRMGSPIAAPVGRSGATIACLSPSPPSRTGGRLGEKRARERWETDYLAWALADFSGYLAIDELYDGPFCVLSIVDNRTLQAALLPSVKTMIRTQDDMLAFFQRFQAVLQTRHLTVRGITTRWFAVVSRDDSGRLWPGSASNLRVPYAERPHPRHLAGGRPQARKQLAAQQPKLGRGRPTKAKRKPGAPTPTPSTENRRPV